MRYILLPGKNPSFEDSHFHKIAFDFWYSNWSDFFQKKDPDYKLNADDFFRQDYIGLLVDGETPLAIHLYSIFDLTISHQLKQSYLNYNFTESFFKKTVSLGIKKVLTFESLMVNPNFRKTETGYSIAPILFAEGIQLLKSIKNVDAMMAPARRDIGVAKLAECCGAEVVEDHDLHGIPVSLIIGKKDKLHLNYLNEFERRKAVQIFNEAQVIKSISNWESANEFAKKIAG